MEKYDAEKDLRFEEYEFSWSSDGARAVFHIIPFVVHHNRHPERLAGFLNPSEAEHTEPTFIQFEGTQQLSR